MFAGNYQTHKDIRKVVLAVPTDFSDFHTKQGTYTFTIRGYNSELPNLYKDNLLDLELKAECY